MKTDVNNNDNNVRRCERCSENILFSTNNPIELSTSFILMNIII